MYFALLFPQVWGNKYTWNSPGGDYCSVYRDRIMGVCNGAVYEKLGQYTDLKMCF